MTSEPEKVEGEERVTLFPSLLMTRRQRSRVWLVALALLVLWWLVAQSWAALGPFIFGLVLAYLMLPLVDRLARLMPRVLAILLVYLVFVLAVVGLVSWLAPVISGQVGELVENAPGYERQVEEWGRDAIGWYNELPLTTEVRQSIEDALSSSLNFVGSAAQAALLGTLSFVSRAMGAVVGFIIIPFWLFYVLLDKEKGINGLNHMLPRSWRGDVWRILRITNGILGSYIRGQLLLGVVVGIASTIGLLIVGAPYPLLLGLISGIAELIPIVGPILGAIPGLVLAVFSPEGWVMVLKVLIVYVIVQQLENNLLVPKIQGDSVKLHPSIIMVALVVGSQVAGLFGLIVAVPVAAILRDVYLYLYRRYSEGFEPRAAEASVPSRQNEQSARAKEQEARRLAAYRARPGINTGDELIADIEEQRRAGAEIATAGESERGSTSGGNKEQ